MTFKCLDCGHIFEYGEEAVWMEDSGERLHGCPFCKGAYEETTNCRVCYSHNLEDELYCGMCADCLRNAVTYDNFLDYLLETEQLALFMFETVWDAQEPNKVSDKLMVVLRDLYLRNRANDLICEKTDFLALCEKFVMDDNGDDGRIDYAEWLKARG